MKVVKPLALLIVWPCNCAPAAAESTGQAPAWARGCCGGAARSLSGCTSAIGRCYWLLQAAIEPRDWRQSGGSWPICGGCKGGLLMESNFGCLWEPPRETAQRRPTAWQASHGRDLPWALPGPTTIGSIGVLYIRCTLQFTKRSTRRLGAVCTVHTSPTNLSPWPSAGLATCKHAKCPAGAQILGGTMPPPPRARICAPPPSSRQHDLLPSLASAAGWGAAAATATLQTARSHAGPRHLVPTAAARTRRKRPCARTSHGGRRRQRLAPQPPQPPHHRPRPAPARLRRSARAATQLSSCAGQPSATSAAAAALAASASQASAPLHPAPAAHPRRPARPPGCAGPAERVTGLAPAAAAAVTMAWQRRPAA